MHHEPDPRQNTPEDPRLTTLTTMFNRLASNSTTPDNVHIQIAEAPRGQFAGHIWTGTPKTLAGLILDTLGQRPKTRPRPDSTITPEVASEVLHVYGHPGRRPGTHMFHIISAIEHSDPMHRARLAETYGPYVEAVHLARNVDGGVWKLMRIAKGATHPHEPYVSAVRETLADIVAGTFSEHGPDQDRLGVLITTNREQASAAGFPNGLVLLWNSSLGWRYGTRPDTAGGAGGERLIDVHPLVRTTMDHGPNLWGLPRPEDVATAVRILLHGGDRSKLPLLVEPVVRTLRNMPLTDELRDALGSGVIGEYLAGALAVFALPPDQRGPYKPSSL